MREGSTATIDGPLRLSRPIWLLVACVACIVLRGPAFRYGTISDDEAIYDTMAQEIVAGGVLYKHTVDHKPPGIAYTYAALESLSGNGQHRMAFVHLFGILVVLGTCFGLYLVGREILTPPLEVVPPLLYAVTSTTKVPYDALAVNGELLMNLPSVFAVGCALMAVDGSTSRALALDVLTGLLISVAFLFKYQAGIMLCALPFIALDSKSQRWRSRVCAWIIGFSAPIVGFAVYFYRAGALHEAIYWGVAFNAQYIRSGASAAWATQRLARQCMGVIVPGGLLYASAAITLTRLIRGDDCADIRRCRRFMVAWSVLSLLAVAIGGRYFGHYFLQPELPLSIAAAGPAARLFLEKRWAFASLLVVPALLFSVGATLPGTPGRWLDDDAIDYESVGSKVAARTKPGDSIWIWGNMPRLYYSAHRRAGTRFTFCNYLTGLSPGTASEYDTALDPTDRSETRAWSQVLGDLAVRRPRLILDTAAARWKSYGKFPINRYPEFSRYLAEHYRNSGDIDGAVVYDWVK